MGTFFCGDVHTECEPLPWHKNTPNLLILGLQWGEEKKTQFEEKMNTVWGSRASQSHLDLCSQKAKKPRQFLCTK